MATVLSVFMAGTFLFLVHGLGLHGFLPALKLALAIWMIAVVPITVTNFIFIKLHPGVLISHFARMARAPDRIRGILRGDSRPMTEQVSGPGSVLVPPATICTKSRT